MVLLISCKGARASVDGICWFWGMDWLVSSSEIVIFVDLVTRAIAALALETRSNVLVFVSVRDAPDPR